MSSACGIHFKSKKASVLDRVSPRFNYFALSFIDIENIQAEIDHQIIDDDNKSELNVINYDIPNSEEDPLKVATFQEITRKSKLIISSQNIPKKGGHHQDSIKPRFPKCESCNEYFSDYHKLNQHLDDVHTKTKNFDTENINDDDDNGSELKLDPKDSLKSIKIEATDTNKFL